MAGAGAVALAGAGLSPAEAAAAVPKKWDKSADVVVVGYGGAGAVAAVTAHDAGAKVLILEKQAEGRHTSNTQMCLGVFLSPDSVRGVLDYFEVASRVNVDLPESKDIDDAVVKVWAETSVQNKEWMTKMGAKEFVLFANSGRDPKWPGNSAIKAYQLKGADGKGEVGVGLFKFLDGLVTTRKIETLWEAPAVRLITNAKGEVVGVRAKRQGKEIAVQAKRAVVLTCGGYEYDAAAQRTYMAAAPMVYYGNPDNTGDGLRMAQELGADLWHMTVLGGGLKLKFPDFPTAFGEAFGTGSYIVVDKTGKRFKAENQLGGYSGYWNALVYDTVRYTWPRIPVYYVFDEKRRLAGPIVRTVLGAAGPLGMYKWSPDNSAEVARGWIKKDETLEGLAGKIGVDPAALAAEVAKVNGFKAKGKDEDFDRPAASMAPLEAPFYAVPLWPGLNNTFGGPRRNEKAQIVGVFGKPIPRLYSAGELGSIFVQYPQGGANIGECIAFGRIAGAQAAAEKPWKK
jgi:succinate dehydrogenase/fumarate reductase flavoprotein subunit